MEKKDLKLLLKEFLFVPSLLIILILLISKMNIFRSEEIINYFCLIFASTILLIFLEEFLMFDVPNNLSFSRFCGVVASSLCFFLFFTFFKNINSLIWVIASIYLGQGLSYLFLRFVNFKRSGLISIIALIIVSFLLAFFEFF